jgi:hypothetical protein
MVGSYSAGPRRQPPPVTRACGVGAKSCGFHAIESFAEGFIARRDPE